MYRAKLPSKPNVELAHSLFSAYSPRPSLSTPVRYRLIIFLNNLLLPASSWETTIRLLNKDNTTAHPLEKEDLIYNPQSYPGMIPVLTYDRFGQGATTDRDPLDSRPNAELGYGHDFTNVVSDLHALITLLIPTLFPNPNSKTQQVELLLVGASIGAPIARLYAETHPRTVAGIVLLDSNIANANYSSFWPDPQAPNFDPAGVIAPDCTLEEYIRQTEKLGLLFDLDVRNRENLDRRNSSILLPHANRPVLIGPSLSESEQEDQRTKILVVGHDPETFAAEGLERLCTPRSLTNRWIRPVWERYNRDLLQIGDSSAFGSEVRIARGGGHFIQQDDPQFVADVVREMMSVLGW